MNKGTLIGFISSDIKTETLNLKSGETMRKVGFNIACNRKGKNNGADFPRVVAFGKTADVIERYLGKGKGVIVQFHVQTSSYTNKEGKKIYQTDLVCDEIEFPPVRKSEEQENTTPTHTSQDNAEPPSAPDDMMQYIPDTDAVDLPFI